MVYTTAKQKRHLYQGSGIYKALYEIIRSGPHENDLSLHFSKTKLLSLKTGNDQSFQSTFCRWRQLVYLDGV